MSVFCKQLNPHACRTYMIGTDGIGLDKIGEVVLIDPVLEHFPDYIELLNQKGYKPTHVIDTHTHADHISGAAALKDSTGCFYMMHRKAPAKCVDFSVADGFEWELIGPLGHLEGITHIPIGSLSRRLEELGSCREREIVTVCRSGARAHTAAQILSTAEFPRVSVLIGGMIAWNAQRD